jgi:protease-4
MRRVLIFILVLIFLTFSISVIGAYLLSKHEGVAFGEKVAVIPLYGTISYSQDTGFFAESRVTPAKFKEQLKKAENDDSVKAIVIDINSPGGSVVASEEIATALERTSKPTVAWLSEVATSGAYYVASSADYIVADKASITGSIGVISVFPQFSELLDKIGVNFTIIKGGEFKDFSTGYRPMRDEEIEMMEEVVSEIYDQFLWKIASNRNFSIEYARSIAEGKVYSGVKAAELGLVDEIGDREKAIEIASRMGGIKGEPKVVTYRKSGILEEFIGSAFMNIGYGFAKGLVEGYTHLMAEP